MKAERLWQYLNVLFCVVVLLAGCASADQDLMASHESRLDEAKKLWQSRGIADYRIQIKMTYSDLGGELAMVVRNGQPVYQECLSEGCTLLDLHGPDTGRVRRADDLFFMARYNVLQTTSQRYLPGDCLQITFDDEYGLPRQIDNADCIDPDVKGLNKPGRIEIVSFEPIDPVLDPFPTKGPPSENWEQRWLQGILCRPPCWEGVTPGVTGKEEAVKILMQSPLISELRLDTIALTKSGILEWRWVDGTDGGRAEYDVNNPNKTVLYLHPSLGVLRLGEIIEAFGSPSGIIALDYCGPEGGRYYDSAIVYDPLGILLGGPGGIYKPVIDENTSISSIVFYDPVSGPPGPSEHEIVPWQSFQDFYFYSGTTEKDTCPEYQPTFQPTG